MGGLKSVKKEIRILGIDDSSFDKFKHKKVLLIGTIYRGGDWPDGILSTKISVDGSDSTKKIIEMVNKTKHKPQLQVIMLDGIAFGGFNVVDINSLHEKTGLPVVTIMRDYPNMEKIEAAIKNVSSSDKKLKLIKAAGKVHKTQVKDGNLYFQCVGIECAQVVDILNIACTRSLVPEPIRMAHLIASGVATGESKGRA